MFISITEFVSWLQQSDYIKLFRKNTAHLHYLLDWVFCLQHLISAKMIIHVFIFHFSPRHGSQSLSVSSDKKHWSDRPRKKQPFSYFDRLKIGWQSNLR